MYYYIYDTFLAGQKYTKTLHKIENRVHDLGINGKIGRLAVLKNLDDIIKRAYQDGARNFIAVGNDDTLHKVISACGEMDVTVGYIPIGGDNYMAQLLGIQSEELACDVLSARIVRIADLGKVNNHYFFSSITMSLSEFQLNCDNSYAVKSEQKDYSIKVLNVNTLNQSQKFLENVRAEDGWLNILIHKDVPKTSLIRIFKKGEGKDSIFPVKHAVLGSSKEATALVDGYKSFKLPLDLQIIPKSLKIVVGKNRKVLLS